MTSVEAKKYLWDAQAAADRLSRFTAGKSFEDYKASELLRSAVERQFEIIGEALVNLRKIAPDVAAQIPDLARIIAFRNILIHGYATVDDKLVWGVVETDVPVLRRTLKQLLASPN